MNVIYAREPLPKEINGSIFLAGPSPRNLDVKSWRPEALEFLEAQGFTGTVFVPEDRSKNKTFNYENQIEWEELCLNVADVIVFWVPRNMDNMPALTTNVEFGMWFDSGKVVFGAPDDAPSVNYLKHYVKKENIPLFNDLGRTLEQAISLIGDGAWRCDGEVFVPLHIWDNPSFQTWYQHQKNVGNQLCKAKVLWAYRYGKKKQHTYAWALHVDVYVLSEDRHKSKEIIISRPDISTLVLYRKNKDLLETDLVLIREFRSPVANSIGFVLETPGGSSYEAGKDSRDVAATECSEETCIPMSVDRLRFHHSRQLAATFSAHKGYMYSAEVTDEEIDLVKSQLGVMRNGTGDIEDSELTYTEIHKFKDLLENDHVDWVTLGMISEALLS